MAYFYMFLTALFMSSTVVARISEPYKEYLNLLSDSCYLGKEGNYKEAEIQIITDPKKIKEVEELQYMRLLGQGVTQEEAREASRVGVVTKDQYWTWIRDAVIFPTGAEGTYNRMVWSIGLQNKSNPGVVILPLLEDHKIALNLNYRHATRSWELEIPRGLCKSGENEDAAVKRELEEETGLIISEKIFLGEVTPDTSSWSSAIPVYAVKVAKQGISNQDYTEAILRIEFFTLEEIKKAFAEGSVELSIKGKKEKAFVRDGFLAYAILQAEIKKLL